MVFTFSSEQKDTAKMKYRISFSSKLKKERERIISLKYYSKAKPVVLLVLVYGYLFTLSINFYSSIEVTLFNLNLCKAD